MYHLFNPENKFWNFIAKITDAACMSILWALASLPLFTIGAATTAFYDFSLHQVNDREGKILKSFFGSFRAHFGRATLLWLTELAGIAFFALDLWAAWNFYLTKGGVIGIALMGFCACFALIFLSCVMYVYPLLAAFNFNLKKILRDSFIMAMGNLHVTITLFVMTALVCVLIYYVSGLFFFWIGLYIFFSSYFITGVFLKYVRDPEEEAGKEQLEE
ncbi:MAG: DUF624 domain-containing protein [Clostridiales bacterium]|nr:DUF624 domain-containing protein [Clostridiales bacterium]